MKLIPDVLFSCRSGAERKVFDLLREVDLGKDWTAYHSLNCSEHAYKHWSEIDFLLTGPMGLYVLEVKGGGISRKDGVWRYTDRFGRDHTSTEGPFEQARSAMYALRDLLGARYRVEATTRDRAVFGFGVVFPDGDWVADTPETPMVVAADRRRCAAQSGFRLFLEDLVEYWRRKVPEPGVLSSRELAEIHGRLRPDVDVYPPLTLRIGTALHEMQRLTDEQYERLETIECNERVVVSGGAGTGKTFLLVQCARREVARGSTVLVVAQSPVLATFLRRKVPDRGVEISQVEELRQRRAAPVDVLFVDEGQDLMDVGSLELLGQHLRGGLDQGRWRWFMDENNQAGLSGRFDPEALKLLQEGLVSGRPVRLPLVRNVRNTKEIVRKVQLWTGADIGRTEVTGFGSEPRFVDCGTNEWILELDRVVGQLLSDGAEPEEIGIVLPRGERGLGGGDVPPRLRKLLVPLDTATVQSELRGRILWGPVERFKGLERPIVMVAGFEGLEDLESRVAELYVATTRGNYGLWLFGGPKLRAFLRRRELANRPLVERGAR